MADCRKKFVFIMLGKNAELHCITAWVGGGGPGSAKLHIKSSFVMLKHPRPQILQTVQWTTGGNAVCASLVW